MLSIVLRFCNSRSVGQTVAVSVEKHEVCSAGVCAISVAVFEVSKIKGQAGVTFLPCILDLQKCLGSDTTHCGVGPLVNYQKTYLGTGRYNEAAHTRN